VNKNDDFHEVSYKKNMATYDAYATGREKANLARTWLEKDSVNKARFGRMYRMLDPLLEAEPDAKWLTVGDGRYGADAMYIRDHGLEVLATDITDTLLKEAKEMGWLKEYRIENAESLSFNNSEFDFVFCKESYHHFPRPMIALYEMLRVASKGVVLIEPTDPYINGRFTNVLFRNLLDFVKSLIGKSTQKHGFEEAGNYVYTISRREIEKLAEGMNYSTVAFSGLNDHYVNGVEYEKAGDKGRLYRKVMFRIGLLNLLERAGVYDYVLTVAVIFKKEPSALMTEKLKKAGYDVFNLPVNPHAPD